MAPRSFSEDGAPGAGATVPSQPSQPAAQASQFLSSGGLQDPFSGSAGTPANPRGGAVGVGGASRAPDGFGGDVSAAHGSMPGVSAVGLSFAAGGAIDTGDDPQQDSGNPMGDMIQKALGTVGQVLDFGRKRHGLGGGGDDEGAIPGAQTAARMPMYPGNQSESGAPRPLPPPGPLPPTANPFGKRADADGDQDGDTGGAIDTDEETA